MLKNLYLLIALMLSVSLGLVGCPATGDDDDASAGDDDDATPPTDDDDAADDDDASDDDDAADDDDFDFNQIQFSFAVTVLPPGAEPPEDEGRDEATDDDDSAASDDDDSAATDDDDSATTDDDDSATTDDDDSVSTDDDDSAATDDDDSATTDDDDATDDDDSADDDDDATDDDDSAVADTYTTSAEFFFTYLVVDQAAGTGEVTCNQRVLVEGTADFGFGLVDGCDNCTGQLTFDSSTAVDISNPAKNPDDCDPAFLEANNVSMGLAMLNEFGADTGYWPTEEGTRNFGDFLTIATMDENTQEVLGYDGSATGAVDLTAAGNADWALNTYGADFTHVGLVNGSEGANTLAAESGIGQVANAAGVGSDYYFYFVIAKDPAANTYEGMDMQGDYFGFARFVITFGA